MARKVTMLGVTLLIFRCLALAADKSTFTGVVSDTHCRAKHATAGDSTAACVSKCAAGGASHVLVTSDGKVYQLDNQDNSKDYAGESVSVVGTASRDAISAASVEAG